MSKQEPDWTIPALKQYVDQRFEAAQTAVDKAVGTTSLAVDKAFIENQRAIDKAEEALSKRLEGMNELREQLNLQAASFATIPVVDAIKGQVGTLTTELAEFKAISTGSRATLGAQYGELNGKLALLLDPRQGIYSTQHNDTSQLKTWAIAGLTTLIVGIVVGLITIVSLHK